MTFEIFVKQARAAANRFYLAGIEGDVTYLQVEIVSTLHKRLGGVDSDELIYSVYTPATEHCKATTPAR